MENVKVVIWGFGAMGSGIARMLLKKTGVDIVGVCDKAPDKINRSMFDILQMDKKSRSDVIIKVSMDDILSRISADIAIVCTDSYTKQTFEKLRYLIEHKVNVISTAEEMAYPKAQSPELANTLDTLSKKYGVSVLGTGINPGLMMDLLAVVLTGACENVEAVECRRVNSLSPFGPTVMKEQGVGLSLSSFKENAENGAIAGHVGFSESIHMIADAVGFELDGPIVQSQDPIVSKVHRKTPYAEVMPEQVAGVNMEGYGLVKGKKTISMYHPQQIEPQLEHVHTGDYITIKGTPEIKMSIVPEVPGGIGTIAMCVNMIPHVINASPGLKTMLDLPVPRAIMGDMRTLIE